MINLKRGYIVRRASGRTPMVVLSVSPDLSAVMVAYCTSGKDRGKDWELRCGEKHCTDDLALVTNTDEFVACKNWRERLTDDEHKQLDLQCAHEYDEIEQGEDTMTKLYQTKEKTSRFGTLLATNSRGQYVLEMKGTTEVLAFDKELIEEVHPYTVRVRFAGSPQSQEFVSFEGYVEKGDAIVVESEGSAGTLAVVVEVDTKSPKATIELRGRKLVSIPIGGEE